MINANELKILQDSLRTLASGYSELPNFRPEFDVDATAAILQEVATRMHDNYPYHHPLYAGQMLKPPHPIARIAYAMSLWINPNNHALDGGKASSAMEKECIIDLGAMFGWQQPLGHLTGGGTMANLEALWVASRLAPGKHIVGSAQAHYTHSRISDVLSLPYTPVAVDEKGRMNISDLERRLKAGDVGTVVVTMGNTGLGAVDPLPAVLQLREQYDFRIHADAAYGGYFTLANTLSADTRRSFDALQDADSIVIDPHKHGLQPYGCGCILFKDRSVGRLYKHDSPYTYFSSAELHLGEISLECSRAGAAAVALWATQKLLPLVTTGEFASSLDACHGTAQDFHQRLCDSEYFTPLMAPELDIVCYAVNAETSSAASKHARAVFKTAADKNLHLATIDIEAPLLAARMQNMHIDSATVTCLRSVLMKPEQRDWTESIVQILESCAQQLSVLQQSTYKQ